LNAIVKFGVGSFNDRGSSTLKQVNAGHSTLIQVVEEATIGHAGAGCIASAAHVDIGGWESSLPNKEANDQNG
jgi:hypothetical protein